MSAASWLVRGWPWRAVAVGVGLGLPTASIAAVFGLAGSDVGPETLRLAIRGGVEVTGTISLFTVVDIWLLRRAGLAGRSLAPVVARFMLIAWLGFSAALGATWAAGAPGPSKAAGRFVLIFVEALTLSFPALAWASGIWGQLTGVNERGDDYGQT